MTTDPDDPTQRLLTTGEAAEVAHVAEATIRVWHSRGLLEQQDDGLYREMDVLQVEQQTRRNSRLCRLIQDAVSSLA